MIAPFLSLVEDGSPSPLDVWATSLAPAENAAAGRAKNTCGCGGPSQLHEDRLAAISPCRTYVTVNYGSRSMPAMAVQCGELLSTCSWNANSCRSCEIARSWSPDELVRSGWSSSHGRYDELSCVTAI